MKHIRKFLILIFFLPIIAFSQQFFIKPFYSLSAPLFPTQYSFASDETTVTIDTSITDYSYENYSLSLGAGTRMGLALEYQFNDNIALGFSASWFRNKEKSMEFSSSLEYDPYFIYNVKIIETHVYKNKAIDFSLYSHIYLKKGNTAPYVNTGIIFGFANYTLNKEVFIRNNLPGYYPTETYLYEYKLTPSFHYGFSGAFGIEFLRDKFLSVFIETNTILMTSSPNNSSCTSMTWNGEDQIEELTESELETVFVESYSDSDNTNENEPSKALSFSQSFSSIGLMAGVRISF